MSEISRRCGRSLGLVHAAAKDSSLFLLSRMRGPAACLPVTTWLAIDQGAQSTRLRRRVATGGGSGGGAHPQPTPKWPSVMSTSVRCTRCASDQESRVRLEQKLSGVISTPREVRRTNSACSRRRCGGAEPVMVFRMTCAAEVAVGPRPGRPRSGHGGPRSHALTTCS